MLIYVERGYINPVTHIGNDRSETIPPRVIHYAPVNKKVIANQFFAAGLTLTFISKILGF
jgi:hypothetical protein